MVTDTRAFAIGETSRRTGVNIETIRYYERVGILSKPARSRGGRRYFTGEQVRRLAFVKRARELGFSLADIRTMLRLVDGGTIGCADIRAVSLHHLDEVSRKIADLQRVERVLADIVARCAGGAAPECPIIEALFDEESPPRP